MCTKCVKLATFSFLLTVSLVSCDILLNDFIYEKDLCKDICVDSFFLLPLIPDAQSICQRGCRFFNIIYLKDEHDFNATRDECFESCNESYQRALMRNACITGCKAMSKKKESEVTNVLLLIDQEKQKNVIFLEPELELLESDILSDPLIHSQIEIGYNIEYKIPETNIRTMPIEEFIEFERESTTRHQQQITTDWLDCAARNSGIPKWILMPAILTAVIIAVWLSFGTFTERRDKEEILLEDEKNDECVKSVYCPVESVDIEYIKKPLPETDMV